MRLWLSQWYHTGRETTNRLIENLKGLVIERGDRVVNLCEMKFASDKFAIGADYAARLREKVGAFKRETGTHGNCHLTFVTTYGLRRNIHCGIVQSGVTLDDLFRA